MEIWALCGACDRWFYCPKWFDRSAPAPVCPVCCREPVAIENRAGRWVVSVVDHRKPPRPRSSRLVAEAPAAPSELWIG